MVFCLSGLFFLSGLVGGRRRRPIFSKWFSGGRRPPTDFSKWFRVAAGHVEGAEDRAKKDFGLLDY